VLGGATMLTQSPRFMMIKPTIVHFAVAIVMLRRGWMLRYLPEIVLRNVPEPTIVAAGYAWAALLAALGLANLFIALRLDFATWAWFISVGSVGAKLTGFALQYGVFRRRARRSLAPSAPTSVETRFRRLERRAAGGARAVSRRTPLSSRRTRNTRADIDQRAG
jgi:hypothetical protein